VPATSAADIFHEGLAALSQDDPARAAEAFKTAMEIGGERHEGRNNARYLSYHGLALARAQGVNRFCLAACRKAVDRKPRDPDMWLNLGRVWLLARDRKQARKAFGRGLELSPRHPALRQEVLRIERRAGSVLPALHRDHPLNILLGKLRWRWWRRRRRSDDSAEAASANGARS
jgi:tetratricopeptide (TPR) repeat protein